MRSQIATRLVVIVLASCVLFASSGVAQTSNRTFAVELVVTKDKKSIETDADIIFGEKTVRIVPDKASLKRETREFAYSDIYLVVAIDLWVASNKRRDSVAKHPKPTTPGAFT